ncbi:BQ2448_3115 [Microbotryum intermedium]|uniref:Copper transport protein n=1 Tax=Microbotryum intermedium TaxID=269621 RepID=A0A238FEA1_9BASI|nr:BQ2448_3115 [Microbotryum intermedium]
MAHTRAHTAPSANALRLLILVAATRPVIILAHGADMDMNMSNSSSATMGTSFSTTIGSAQLWFDGWIPTGSSSTAGACVGLALLAIFSRFLAAVRTSCEANWTQSIMRQRLAQHRPLVDATLLNTVSMTPSGSDLDGDSDPADRARARTQSDLIDLLHKFHSSPAPFTPSIDLPRTVIFTLQAFIGYLLMLAIMTYSAWFFIAIIAGLAVGELLFGRSINRHGHSAELGLHH